MKSAILVNKKLCVVGSQPKFWSKSKVSLQSSDAGVGFLRSEREVRCLEATGLASEKSLELLMAMVSVSTWREFFDILQCTTLPPAADSAPETGP